MVCITDPSEILGEATDSPPRTMHLIPAAQDLGADDPREPRAAWNVGAGGPGAYLPLCPSLTSLTKAPSWPERQPQGTFS